ncbi:carbon monoxide dehydrogenase [Actinobacteria bacterium YIM 96077]|uniref:Carbon monoxide dehydrogenase n=1 Tax=Phytoactinopolyspora halophila TaxID=1981511 RepID=A0A329QMR7_9ACTN|nr:carbon monoxide dehydrogenase subunit G [Phytoactinopolyspora halophila]AYY12957.1 carbon monoxide dehydrogenase [Actinobacteria bacterium YIM 96077]RAW13221.1 carbon monoxide dehydrogenase [Phytoactinopolyspora halophila]
MKVTGSAALHAPRDQVWQALNDPAVLVRTIPGCQRLEETGPDAYRMTVYAGVGSVKGTYAGNVQLTDQEEPSSFVLKAQGSGAPGTVSADVKVTLSENGDGVTTLDYDADAIVGGMIGGVGQRMLTGVAKKTAGEFFSAVDDVLTGRAATGAGAGTSGAEGAGPAAPADQAVPAASGVPGMPAGAASSAGSRPGVYEAPATPASQGTGLAGVLGGDFGRGVLAGAVIALAGVVVGGWAAGRRR